MTPSIVSEGSTPKAMVELAFTKICVRRDHDNVDPEREKGREMLAGQCKVGSNESHSTTAGTKTGCGGFAALELE